MLRLLEMSVNLKNKRTLSRIVLEALQTTRVSFHAIINAPGLFDIQISDTISVMASSLSSSIPS